MEYKVLYRKYRPKAFNDIVGQKSVTTTLKNSIIQNKISHAYIFSGMRGTGKTSIAKIFAKAINCLNNTDGNPCNECINCLAFNNSTDVIEIDAASNNGVDEIREIVSNSRLVPNMYKYKVYIIDEVHMLSIGAFNALLKTLEEPFEHIVFILATTDIQKVPLTILSRCQRFDFGRINIEEMSNYLKKICEQENIKADEDAISEISYLSDGALRDALSLLDQLAKQSDEVTLSLIEDTVGTISNNRILDLIENISRKDSINIIKMITTYKDKQYDISILLKKLINELNDQHSKQMFVKQILSAINIKYNEIINSFDSYLSLELIILEYIDDTSEAKPITEGKENIKESVIKAETPAKPIDDQGTNVAQSKEKGSLYTNIDEIFHIRINNCFVQANKDELAINKRIWKETLNNLENIDIGIYSIISESQVVLSSLKNMVVMLPTESEITLAKGKYELILEKLENINKKIAFISSDNWNKVKTKYINDVKNKTVYLEIEEPKLIKIKKDENFSTSAKELFGDENVDVV